MYSLILTLPNKGFVVMKTGRQRNNNSGLVMVAFQHVALLRHTPKP